jgi:hypothetical protein
MSHRVFPSLPFSVHCLLGAFLSFAALAHGQGTPSWSAYDGNTVDTVNLSNLNVVLNIPIMSKSGAFPLALSYTGGNSYVYASGTSLKAGITAVPLMGAVNDAINFVGGGWGAVPSIVWSVKDPVLG